MTIGPVQLLVLGFPEPDALAVHKDDADEVEVLHLHNISDDEAVELGSKIGALIGLAAAKSG
jgi:rRNA processing protein Krr1/Pno1